MNIKTTKTTQAVPPPRVPPPPVDIVNKGLATETPLWTWIKKLFKRK